MEPKDTFEAIRNYGLPLVFLMATVWIGVNKLWPFLERRVEHSEKLSRDILETSQSRWAEASKEFVTTLQHERAILERIVQEMDKIKIDTTEIKAAIQIIAKHGRVTD